MLRPYPVLDCVASGPLRASWQEGRSWLLGAERRGGEPLPSLVEQRFQSVRVAAMYPVTQILAIRGTGSGCGLS